MSNEVQEEVQEEVTNLVAEALSAGPSDGEFHTMIAGTDSTVKFRQDGTFKVTIPDQNCGEKTVEGEVLVKIKKKDNFN